MLLSVADILLIFSPLLSISFNFNLYNLNKNSALIFHTYLSMCLTLSETEKKKLILKKKLFQFLSFQFSFFSDMF